MLKYSIKRIVLALVTAFIILTLTFFLVKSLPPTKFFASDENLIYGFYEKQARLGYVLPSDVLRPDIADEPLFQYEVLGKWVYYYEMPVMDQYLSWLKNIVTKWDWGTSTQIMKNVDTILIIKERLPVTVSVNVIAVLLSVPLGILLGIIAGLKKNTWIDHTISTLVMVFISIPSFVVISFMIYLFAVKGNLPFVFPDKDQTFAVKASGYVIPVLALSFGSVCGYCRFVRAELCEVMSSEYLLLARTKGLTKTQAITRHALRNAFVPILPSILAEVIGVFSGSMILENLYDIHGIGDLYVRALTPGSEDYNVLMVDMAIFTTVGLLAGIVLDLSYGFIDPRIRMGEKR